MTGWIGALFWLVVSVVLFVIEGMAVQLICVWFAVGALLAMLAAALGASVPVQLLVFLLSSVAVLLLGRPLLKKKLKFKQTATNADLVIGKIGVVLEEVNNDLQTGRVTANGLDWTARSTIDSVIIPAGAKIRAVYIDGVKLIVELAEPDKEQKQEGK